MKILFVSAVLPYPLFSGGQIRIYNLLKLLSEKHEITLATFIRNENEKTFAKELSFLKKVHTVYRGHAWRPEYVTRSTFGPYPLLMESYHNRLMLDFLTDEIGTGGYHIIHAEPGYVWPSIPRSRVPTVVCEHNIEHTIYEKFVRQFSIMPLRPFMSLDVKKIKFWEKRIWQSASRIVAVSEDDKKEIETTTGRSDIAVVPNGVDIKAFVVRKKSVAPKAPVFLFVGNFSWIQNRDAILYLVEEIWPEIVKTFPGATLRVVGKQATNEIRKRMNTKGVLLLEQIDDIREEFSRADIMLAPIRIGGGTKFKILEAMASGVPVITTTQGTQGLAVTSGSELFVAATSEEFLAHAQMLLTNEKRRLSVTAKGRMLIEKKYSWNTIAGELDSVWSSAYGK